MNCKKTIFGYLNFILTTLLTGAMFMLLMYSLLGSALKNITASHVIWIAPVLSIFSTVIVFLLYYFLWKFRKKLSLKINIFRSNRIPEFIGGFTNLAIFMAGLFLRINLIKNFSFTNRDYEMAVSVFDGKTSVIITKPDTVFAGLMAFIFRFAGIKSEIIKWVILGLEVLLILIIFEIIRNVFNEIVCIPVMIYLCLINSSFTNDSQKLTKFLMLSLVLLILVELTKCFKFNIHYETICLVVFILLGLIFVYFIPILMSDTVKGVISLGVKEGLNFYDFLIPQGTKNLILNIVIVGFMFIGAFSFAFSKKDLLSPISFLWLIAMVYEIFSKTNWPDTVTINILFYGIAGIGLYNLFFSVVYEKTGEDNLKTVHAEKKVIVVDKPETVEVEKIKVAGIEEKASVMEDEKQTQNEIKLLHNPLPVPKAHVKKEISYSFEPDEENMHFDIDVSDNDDFDV